MHLPGDSYTLSHHLYTSATKADLINTGVPNKGMIFITDIWPPQSMWVGLSPILQRYRQTPTGICILEPMAFWWSPQSSFQEEFHQCSAPGEALLALVWGYFWYIGYISHILPYLYGRDWGHKTTGSGWSQGLFILNEFLLGTASQM
jgi:hypothetical protein